MLWCVEDIFKLIELSQYLLKIKKNLYFKLLKIPLAHNDNNFVIFN